MLVDEWVETVWKVLQVRPKTVHDYKRLYRRHLSPVIGANHLDDVSPQILQRKLLSLPPQTARHTLMLAKTIWREAENYGVVWDNPLGKLKTPQIQIAPRKLILCSSFVRFPNRLASLANLLGLASYPIYLVHTHLGTAIINVLNARIENATVVFQRIG